MTKTIENLAVLEEAYKGYEDREKYRKKVNRIIMGAAIINIPVMFGISYVVKKYDPVFNLIHYISNQLTNYLAK